MAHHQRTKPLSPPFFGRCHALDIPGLQRPLSYPQNAPSVRVMQKIGMRDDGEFEAYGRRMVRYVAEPG